MVSWGRADLHMHTTASDGWPTPVQIVDHAVRRAALNVIAITDHDTIEGALRAADHATKRRKVHVVVGEEVSSRDGHIVGLFLERRVKPGMSAAATVHARSIGGELGRPVRVQCPRPRGRRPRRRRRSGHPAR